MEAPQGVGVGVGVGVRVGVRPGAGVFVALALLVAEGLGVAVPGLDVGVLLGFGVLLGVGVAFVRDGLVPLGVGVAVGAGVGVGVIPKRCQAVSIHSCGTAPGGNASSASQSLAAPIGLPIAS